MPIFFFLNHGMDFSYQWKIHWVHTHSRINHGVKIQRWPANYTGYTIVYQMHKCVRKHTVYFVADKTK